MAEVVVAKIAAFHAARVPGVAGLRARGWTASPGEPGELPAAGVDVEVDHDASTTEIEANIVICFGYSCLDVAEAIRRQVGAHVEFDTGLRPTIAVNVVDVAPPTLSVGGSPGSWP